jgi:hypothetical protein
VAPATIADLRLRLATGDDAPVTVSVVDLHGTSVAKVSFQLLVALDGVDERLRGVFCPAVVPALVGESGSAAALLHAPRPGAAPEEARRFVRSLLDNGQLGAVGAPTVQRPTHVVVDNRGRREVRRVAFAC